MRTLKRSTEWRTGLGDFSDCLLAGLLVALAAVAVRTCELVATGGREAAASPGGTARGPEWRRRSAGDPAESRAAGGPAWRRAFVAAARESAAAPRKALLLTAALGLAALLVW